VRGHQRPCAGAALAGHAFVYRRYLDYGVFEGLRQLHRKIRDEAQRRAAGRPERANDVKLSRGGIREIEFIVQLLLVVRGGQFPEIRTRSTLRPAALAERGLMKADTARSSPPAYVFLRRVEHRIQFLDDQQTHLLPTADGDLAWIALSLGLTCRAEACELLDRLGEVRELVAGEFDVLLHDSQAPATRNGCRTCGPGRWPVDSESLLEQLPPELAERVKPWTSTPRVLALRDESKHAPGPAGAARRRCATAAAPEAATALHRLDRAAAAPRELPRAAGRAARGAAPPAAPAGPGALADAVPDAPPRRDRRAGRRTAAARALRP
jgi:hypothetical protein